ncbi:RHS repeat-associated core domain-containing protein [Pseudomonas idahonensis]|uniref:RHS repeat-associated core domain-containing protein n=1 Tax=Pseudomonas idahonensis TaxID=2942628 RepID=UPI0030D61E37
MKEERSSSALQQGISNPIKFQGQYHDHETGLHYHRYRYYDPEVRRFVSKDPVKYKVGLNLYQYTPSPIKWSDPLGLTKSLEKCRCGTLLPDKAIVCRGGSCTAEKFSQGSGVTEDNDKKPEGASVNSAPNKTLSELTEGIPHSKVGITTAGQIRAKGRDVISSPTRNNKDHATLSGITAEQAEVLMTPTVNNPNR